MAKLKKLVAALLLAGVLLPMGVRAAETVPQNKKYRILKILKT